MKEITDERINPEFCNNIYSYINYLRHIFAYEYSTRYANPAFEVLDLGCGVGYGTIYFAKHVKYITGCDLNPDAIKDAILINTESNCQFELLADDKKLPYPDNHFDLVLCFQVIEHVQNEHIFLQEILRVLKKGGRALLTTPNRERRLAKNQKPWNPYHIKEYSFKELEQLVIAEKFQYNLMSVCLQFPLNWWEEIGVASLKKQTFCNKFVIRFKQFILFHLYANHLFFYKKIFSTKEIYICKRKHGSDLLLQISKLS